MRLRPHHCVRAIIAALAALSVTATAGHTQVTAATRDSQLLASPISAMPPVDVTRLLVLGPGLLADDLVADTGAEAARPMAHSHVSCDAPITCNQARAMAV